MKKIFYSKIFLFVFIVLSSFSLFAASNPLANAATIVNFEKILSSPEITQAFDELKDAASNAEIVEKEGRPYIADADIKKLNAITNKLLQILKSDEHLIPKKYKAHSYVGKNQSSSCYQYYNSLVPASVGKSCSEFPPSFSNCKECNRYVEALKSINKNHILHSHWWKEESITSLVKVIKLKNGDEAYVGFELSPKK